MSEELAELYDFWMERAKSAEAELSELRTVTEEKIHLALAELSGVMPEDEHERDCHRAAVRALSDALERLSRG